MNAVLKIVAGRLIAAMCVAAAPAGAASLFGQALRAVARADCGNRAEAVGGGGLSVDPAHLLRGIFER